MSWIQLDDEEFSIQGPDAGMIPRDLQRIASMLQSATLTGEDGGFGPVPDDAGAESEITTERDQLMGRFLDVRWTADEAGNVQSLVVSGQLPVYDDVEAVSSSDPAVTEGKYRVVASASQAKSDDLEVAGTDYPDWVTQRYLSLPDTITPRTVELTQSITAASDNPYDQARAIEQYLRETITYDESVEAPPDGNDIVDYLLFERRRGYCEYSASAMTVMLRSIGIPARVAVGFYPGDFDQNQAGYLYLQKNAHAWTEVFFPGYGWIPFEPTSSQPLIEEGSGIGEDQPDPEPTNIAIEETPAGVTPTLEASPAAGQGESDTVQPQVTPNPRGRGIDWVLIAGLSTFLGVAVSLAGWFFWSFPLRGMTASSSLFMRLRRIGSWIGVRPSATSTPQEYGRAFTERVPQAQDHVDRIVKIYEIDQFGPERASTGWLSAAEEAWKALKRQTPRWFMQWRR
jgi:transglutaminase-like putative cysteine protease